MRAEGNSPLWLGETAGAVIGGKNQAGKETGWKRNSLCKAKAGF